MCLCNPLSLLSIVCTVILTNYFCVAPSCRRPCLCNFAPERKSTPASCLFVSCLVSCLFCLILFRFVPALFALCPLQLFPISSLLSRHPSSPLLLILSLFCASLCNCAQPGRVFQHTSTRTTTTATCVYSTPPVPHHHHGPAFSIYLHALLQSRSLLRHHWKLAARLAFAYRQPSNGRSRPNSTGKPNQKKNNEKENNEDKREPLGSTVAAGRNSPRTGDIAGSIANRLARLDRSLFVLSESTCLLCCLTLPG